MQLLERARSSDRVSNAPEAPASILSVPLAAAAMRVLGAAIILLAGFRVVSDDDFARVVIAQKFAAAPHLDPTGTSWLPLPFWIVGAAMKLFGSTLEVARVLAVIFAALAGALVTAVACKVGLTRRRALAAAALTAFMPWAMQLSVSTVPEVPAAACAAAAMIAIASSSSRLRLVAAVALLGSCLSRYDAWPVAAAFAALTVVDATRVRGRARIELLFAAALAIVGPLGWTLWQAVVYHDAFRYLRLVRSYRQALGGAPSIARRILGYPLGLVEDMREVVGAAVLGIVAYFVSRRRRARGLEHGAIADCSVRWGRPLGLAALQLAVLIVGDVRDGAPTHHPERALLSTATVLVFASSDAIGAMLSGERVRARRLAIGIGCALALIGWISLRLHRSLPWFAAAPRPREIAAGRALAAAVPERARVLVDTRDFPNGSIDYGYYAVLAAFGRPLDAEIDRDQDPRKPHVDSSFEDAARLRARATGIDARYVLAWGDAHRGVASALGGRVVAEEEVSASAPRWSIVALP